MSKRYVKVHLKKAVHHPVIEMVPSFTAIWLEIGYLSVLHKIVLCVVASMVMIAAHKIK